MVENKKCVFAYDGNKVKLVVGGVVLVPKDKNMPTHEVFEKANEFLKTFEIENPKEQVKEDKKEKTSPKSLPSKFNKKDVGELLGKENHTSIYENVRKAMFAFIKEKEEVEIIDTLEVIKEWYPELRESTMDVYARSYLKYMTLKNQIVVKKKGLKKFFAINKDANRVDFGYLNNVAKEEKKVQKEVLK